MRGNSWGQQLRLSLLRDSEGGARVLLEGSRPLCCPSPFHYAEDPPLLDGPPPCQSFFHTHSTFTRRRMLWSVYNHPPLTISPHVWSHLVGSLWSCLQNRGPKIAVSLVRHWLLPTECICLFPRLRYKSELGPVSTQQCTKQQKKNPRY